MIKEDVFDYVKLEPACVNIKRHNAQKLLQTAKNHFLTTNDLSYLKDRYTRLQKIWNLHYLKNDGVTCSSNITYCRCLATYHYWSPTLHWQQRVLIWNTVYHCSWSAWYDKHSQWWHDFASFKKLEASALRPKLEDTFFSKNAEWYDHENSSLKTQGSILLMKSYTKTAVASKTSSPGTGRNVMNTAYSYIHYLIRMFSFKWRDHHFFRKEVPFLHE